MAETSYGRYVIHLTRKGLEGFFLSWFEDLCRRHDWKERWATLEIGVRMDAAMVIELHAWSLLSARRYTSWGVSSVALLWGVESLGVC